MRVATLISLIALSLSGCNRGPYGQAQFGGANAATLAQQNAEMQNRLAALDRDNQQHSQLLAQVQQRIRQREEELAAVRQQLRTTTEQLAQAQQEQQHSAQQYQSLLASSRRGGGATIRANSSLRANLPDFNRNDVQVRADGDNVRIVVAGDSLFTPGSTQLTSAAPTILNSIALELARRYPRQRIGVEGHVDGAVQYPQQLSAAQATGVFNQLVSGGQLSANQLFIAGHGSAQPLFSNASPDGQRANRRIELVVYPERVD